jgi:hypothetical protein
MEKLYRKITRTLLENNNYYIAVVSNSARYNNDFIYQFTRYLYHNFPDIYSAKHNEIKFNNNSKIIIRLGYNKLRGYYIDEIYNHSSIKESTTESELFFYESKLDKQFHKKGSLSIFFRKFIT